MERLGASSEEDDGWAFGRISDAFLLRFSFSPLSVSVSDATAEDTDPSPSILRRLTLIVDFRLPWRPSVLEDIVLSGEADRPTAWAVEWRPFRFGRALPSFRSGVNGEKCPSSL